MPADRAGPEVRGIVATVITELTGDLDSEVEASLVRVEDRHVDPKWRIGHLRDAIGRDYSWIDEFDFSDSSQTDRFWFTSATSEEPRRAAPVRTRASTCNMVSTSPRRSTTCESR